MLLNPIKIAIHKDQQQSAAAAASSSDQNVGSAAVDNGTGDVEGSTPLLELLEVTLEVFEAALFQHEQCRERLLEQVAEDCSIRGSRETSGVSPGLM